MKVNSSHPVETSRPALNSGEIFSINNGVLELSNGKTFTITKLIIKGQEQQLTYSPKQLEAIKNLVNEAFGYYIKEASENPNFAELKNFTFKFHPKTGASVTTQIGDKTKTVKIEDANTSSISSHLDKIEEVFCKTHPTPPAGTTYKGTTEKVKGQQSAIGLENVSSLSEGEEPEEPLETSCLLSANPPLETNSLIDDYSLPDGREAYDIVTRENCLDRDILYLEKTVDYLQVEAKKIKDVDQQNQIQKEIEFYQTELGKSKTYRKNNKDWVDSNYFRDLISSCSKFTKAVKEYISVPVNMRYQELEVAGERSVGLYRVGVMSDMRNGWVSLKDLKEFDKLEGKERAQAISKKIVEIEAYIYSHNLKAKKDNKLESANSAKTELESIKTEPALLAGIIADRRRNLQKQMIQLVVGQVEKNPTMLTGGKFTMVHVSLLNQKKQVLDKTGWYHNEKAEIEDMQEIFEEFKGKKLIFDGTGPYIGADGIHLPQEIAEGAAGTVKTLELDTYFFNISVQGNTKNNDFQLENNIKQLDKLMKNHPDLFPKNLEKDFDLDERLRSEHVSSGYPLAEAFLVRLLHTKKLAVSTGCLSAKDRTGMVCGRLMQRFLRTHHKDWERGTPYEKGILDSNRNATKVVAENTPHFRVLKVNVKTTLPGFNDFAKVKIFLRQIHAMFSKKKTTTSKPRS